jgi:uncharacterized membrane protein YdjX (TVP38/TMEM64 family)
MKRGSRASLNATVGPLLGLGLLLLAAIALSRFLPVADWIVHWQGKIMATVFWSAVLYPLLYAACNILLLPGGILAIGSGLFFGLWWGTFLILAGNVFAAAVAFGISRTLGRSWLEKKFHGSRRWRKLDAALRKEGWKIVFLSQVHPLFPTSLLNYLYGVTSIRFWPCMLWIAIGQLPGLFLYAYFGTLTQLGLRLLRGETHPRPVEYALWLGGLTLTLVVTTALGRIAFRLLAQISEPEPSPDHAAEADKMIPSL